MRKIGLLFLMCALALPLGAQQADVALGFGTVTGPGVSSSSPTPQKVGGGLFPVIGGDFIIKKGLGVGAEVAWRGTRSNYLGIIPYRPLFWDINGVWVPKTGKIVVPEVQFGIGSLSTRFYTGQTTCSVSGCTNYVSSNHFMGHFAGGLRFYHGNFFFRPEVHVNLVANNQEFTSGKSVRYGASVGYTFGK